MHAFRAASHIIFSPQSFLITVIWEMFQSRSRVRKVERGVTSPVSFGTSSSSVIDAPCDDRIEIDWLSAAEVGSEFGQDQKFHLALPEDLPWPLVLGTRNGMRAL